MLYSFYIALVCVIELHLECGKGLTALLMPSVLQWTGLVYTVQSHDCQKGQEDQQLLVIDKGFMVAERVCCLVLLLLGLPCSGVGLSLSMTYER